MRFAYTPYGLLQLGIMLDALVGSKSRRRIGGMPPNNRQKRHRLGA